MRLFNVPRRWRIALVQVMAAIIAGLSAASMFRDVTIDVAVSNMLSAICLFALAAEYPDDKAA